MKIFLILVMLIFSNNVFAKPTYLEEVRSLGYIAGQGLACRAKKYHKFELLARAILVGKASNEKLRKEAMNVYNDAKAVTFMSVADSGFSNCDEIVYNFNRQRIFKSILYSDGKIKMYDGSIIIPKKLYDASNLYEKDPEVFNKARESYKKSIVKAKKNSKNAKKIPLVDSNYDKYANQFN